MADINCIPIQLFPREYLCFKSCSLLAGVRLVPLVGGLKSAIDRMDAMSAPVQAINAPLAPTHAVCISEDEYLSGLKSRLCREDKELPKQVFIESNSIVKQAGMALLLTGPIHFKLGDGSYQLSPDANGKGEWETKGWARIGRDEGRASNRGLPLLSIGKKAIEGRQLRDMMGRLDRYFRSGMWWQDRLGMSLEYFWSGVCTNHPGQAFLSFTTALEALLTTGSNEITHSLAERVAVLLGTSTESKLERYRQVKRLYATRSKLVHGKVFPKKGPINAGTLIIGPKYSNVPNDDMKSILELILSLLHCVFHPNYSCTAL